MNRREALQSMTAALVGTSVVGVASAAPWQPESTMLRGACINRAERYARYEKLAKECMTPGRMGTMPSLTGIDNRYYLCDSHMYMNGTRIHDALSLQTDEDKLIFSPFRCGVIAMNAAVYGDVFVEIVRPSWDKAPLSASDITYQMMPPDTVYRIETIKGKLLEFQQSRSGPDYQALTASPEYTKSYAVRFHPEKIVHIRPKCYKYAPYGTSALETGEPVLDADWFNDVFNGIKELHQRMRTT